MSLGLTSIWYFRPPAFLYDLPHPDASHVNRWASSPPEEDATLGDGIPEDFMLEDPGCLGKRPVDIGPGAADRIECDEIDAPDCLREDKDE